MKPIYELVTTAELKVGDIARFGLDDYEDYAIEKVVTGEDFVRFNGEGGDCYPKELVFRRIPATEDPRVLRRALTGTVTRLNDIDWESRDVTAEQWIKQARKELESEATS